MILIPTTPSEAATPPGQEGSFELRAVLKYCFLENAMRIEDKIHNMPERKEFRIRLRKNLTSAEATMWKILKSSKFEGRKFRRQHSVGKYVLDFYCPAERLAIELDGEAHA